MAQRTAAHVLPVGALGSILGTTCSPSITMNNSWVLAGMAIKDEEQKYNEGKDGDK